jgi:NSS family neurotransmitter:Na+ symporter
MTEREHWTSRIGFILAAVGSAVGLGNIWSFPFQTAANGGAAFVLVYLVAVFLIGFPTMLVEFVIGRRSKSNPVDAFDKLGFDNWSFAGAFGVLVCFVTLSFYSVVGGWVLRYIIGSATGAYFGDAAGYFGAIASGIPALGAHALFMALTIGIVAFGVTDGIERATKVMIPAILLLLVGLSVWAVTLSGAADGYTYYLTPDLGALSGNLGSTIPFAVGQAFFTLSLGFSVMIAYSSYLDEDHSLPADGGAIVVVNTLVALLAGFVVFPVLFTIGVEPGTGGLGAAFISLAGAFGQVPGGGAVGTVFFTVLLFAALSSSISLLEVPVSYVSETLEYDRTPVASALGISIFLVGVPSALGTDTLSWYNAVVFQLLIPTGVLLFVLFVGWVGEDQFTAEVNQGSTFGETFTVGWMWWVRLVIPVAVGATLLLGIQSLLLKAGVLESALVLG